jgi:alkyl hydroperoxide reductase subunit AhpF
MPDFPGSGDFDGLQMHSHYYREPSMFKGQRVLVIGSGVSGRDLSIQISECAKQVRGMDFCSNRLISKIYARKNLCQRSLPEDFCVQVLEMVSSLHFLRNILIISSANIL